MAEIIQAEIKPRSSPPWFFFYFLISITGIFLYHRLDYAFTNYVFGDIGASWHAVRLIRAGKLPGVDFAYQYGAFSLGLFDLALGILGDSPRGCYAFGTLSVLVMTLMNIAFAHKIKASQPAMILGIIWALSSQRMLFLSAAHAIEPIVLSAVVLAVVFQKKRIAMILCVFAWFVKPAMAIVMFSMLILWRLFDQNGLHQKAKQVLMDLGLAIIAFLVCFTGSALWLGWQSAATMLFPIQGAGVYKALNFGFFRGSGSSMWHLPGASAFYYLGTQSASWLTLNLTLCFIAIGASVRFMKIKRSDHAFRDPLGELTVFLVLAHSAFVCLFYGQLWSWMYYAWLLWMATLSAFTWLSQFSGFSRFVNQMVYLLVTLSIVGNYSNAKEIYASMRFGQPVESNFGLFGPPEFRQAWLKMKQELKPQPTCISLLIGYGEGVLGKPFYTPDFWCVAPGDTFQPMFDEMDKSIAKADQIVLYMHENLDYFKDRKKTIEAQFELKFHKKIGQNQMELWRRKQKITE